MKTIRPTVLIVLDGVGYNSNPKGNAVISANTPTFDFYRKKYPKCLLNASGESVGLPPGFQGSSEVGHLSMGVGRIIKQELLKINEQLVDGSLYKTKTWKNLICNWKDNNSVFHFLGLLQDEGVHAHQDHLFRMIKQARKEYSNGKIVLHPFLDGRDTPPWSTLEYFSILRKKINNIGNCYIGTFMGRYYGMDRSKNWELTDKALECIINGKGIITNNPEKTILNSYKNDKTPSGEKMFDEYMLPHVTEGYSGILEGDSVLHTNYRQDRAIQISTAFVNDKYPGKTKSIPTIKYAGLTKYYDEFFPYLLETSDKKGEKIDQLVGKVISEAGLRQLRLAETQKFRHVTSFFNGKNTTPFESEDQIEIPSRFDPSSFASHPEMEAYNIVKKFIDLTQLNPYHFILINFANGDMVGHTGNFDSAVKAVEVLDECVAKVVNRVLELDGSVLLTSDHGNCDQMLDYSTGEVRNSHSKFPVECFLISNKTEKISFKKRGNLSDIGPTILSLMRLPIPSEMTASNLILSFSKK